MGFGVAWMDQLVPFQRSASVGEPVGLNDPPTAMHTVPEGHDTAVR